jgi:glycosyltransferase involved in cell wall biosynthesis
MLLPCGWIVAQQCAARGIRFELFGHGTDVDLLLRLPARARARFVRWVGSADAISFPSADKLRRFRQAIGPGSDPAPLRVEPMVHCVPVPPASPGSIRQPEILFLGRLIPQKGVEDLLHAVSRMPGRPAVHIAGDGPQRRRLERLARRLGVAARFHGFVAGAAKEALLERAAVLCVPSREVGGWLSEGAPLVIPEALIRGLPVVATSVGGIPELGSDSGRLHLVPPAHPDALCRALAHALIPLVAP